MAVNNKREKLNEIKSDPPPPFMGSWRNLYLLVLGNLFFWIVLFAIFTWIFR